MQLRVWQVAIVLALSLTAAGAAPLPAELSVAVEGAAVVVSGLAPGGQVALLGAQRTDFAYHSRTETRRSLETDADQDGVVRREFEQAVPWKSVWLAVALGTGAWAAAVPAGFPQAEFPLAASQVTAEPGGASERLHLAERRVEVLHLRPGVGAWAGSAVEGGRGDADGESDGELEVDLAGLAALAEPGPPAPGSLAPGDVVVVVNPEWLSFGVLSVGTAAEGGP
jgi:hypothetical protein